MKCELYLNKVKRKEKAVDLWELACKVLWDVLLRVKYKLYNKTKQNRTKGSDQWN